MANYMQFTRQSRIESITRLRNSRNGNPRFSIVLSNGVSGKTASDSGWAYAICNSWQGKVALAQFKITPKGNVTFTGLELV